MELQPDIALLQEVVSLPSVLSSEYQVLIRKAQRKGGQPQRFSTAILVRGVIDKEIQLSSTVQWVSQELRRFEGNLVAADVTVDGTEDLRVLSVHSPAWPVDRLRLSDYDVSDIKLTLNPDVWVTELLWAGLRDRMKGEVPWVVGGDLDSSITFDTM